MNFPFVLLLIATTIGVDKNHNNEVLESFVEFRINNAGVEVMGVVEAVRVDIKFNELNLRESSIIAVAKTENIKTGITIRDKHLQRIDYFDSDRYPEITLTSVSFKKVARNKFLGKFILEIKHIRKEINVPFTIEQRGASLKYSGVFKIDRLDFELGERSLILDNTVKVIVSASVNK